MEYEMASVIEEKKNDLIAKQEKREAEELYCNGKLYSETRKARANTIKRVKAFDEKLGELE